MHSCVSYVVPQSGDVRIPVTISMNSRAGLYCPVQHLLQEYNSCIRAVPDDPTSVSFRTVSLWPPCSTGTVATRSRSPTTPGGRMTLKLTSHDVDGISVVALDGRIVLGEESTALREKLKGLIAAGKQKIVLNMDNVTYIDSAGLGTLIAAHVSAKNKGASVRLCHLGKKFHEVLQITKLLTVFDVYDTQAAAISSFAGTDTVAAVAGKN